MAGEHLVVVLEVEIHLVDSKEILYFLHSAKVKGTDLVASDPLFQVEMEEVLQPKVQSQDGSCLGYQNGWR